MNGSRLLVVAVLALTAVVAVPAGQLLINFSISSEPAPVSMDEPQTSESPVDAPREGGTAPTLPSSLADALHPIVDAGGSPVAAVLQHAVDPGPIMARLSPFLQAAEPLEVPGAPSLYIATLMHPAHTAADLLYVETLPPMPPQLEASLTRVVVAHGIATSLVATNTPGSGVVAMATLGMVIDQEWNVLTNPGFDTLPRSAPAALTDGVAIPLDVPVEAALLRLYRALGYGPDAMRVLEPLTREASRDVPPQYAGMLGALIDAIAQHQQALHDVYELLAQPAGQEPNDPASLPELLGQVDNTDAILQATLEAVRQAGTVPTSHQGTPPGQVWHDPLGLVVLGTTGADVFDASLQAEPEIRGLLLQALGAADPALGLLPTNLAQTLAPLAVPVLGDTGPTGAVRAETGRTAAAALLPQPGWHILVLDPGGGDVYWNNAGGVDAGAVRLELAVSESGAVTSVLDNHVADGGAICIPSQTLCLFTTDGTAAGSSDSAVARTIGGLPRSTRQNEPFTVETGPIGAGVALVSVVLDLDGNDTYMPSGSVIQGAARGLGTGILVDANGPDTYIAGAFAQGASEDLGLGALIDLQGDDKYLAASRAQGWARLPDASATANALNLVSGNGGDVTLVNGGNDLRLHQRARGLLLDLGGADAYTLDDLLTGQGLTRALQATRLQPATTGGGTETTGSDDGARVDGLRVDGFAGIAALVDIGGYTGLKVPLVGTRDGWRVFTAPPSQVNLSDEPVAELWLQRTLAQDAAGDRHEFLYKTAIDLTNPMREFSPTGGTVWVGRIQVKWEEELINVPDQNVPGLLLLGLNNAPGVVRDPPLLTVVVGTGNATRYEGGVANVTEGSGDLERVRVILDLDSANDVYTGGDDQIASVATNGVALIVDAGGHDTYTGGNRSIGFARTSLLNQPGGGGAGIFVGPVQVPPADAVAAVLELDGIADMRAGSQSIGFGATLQSNRRAIGLVHLGAQSGGVLGETGAHIVGGNQSVGVGFAYGLGAFVGGIGSDTYEVRGWGAGLHLSPRFSRTLPPFDLLFGSGQTPQNAQQAAAQQQQPPGCPPDISPGSDNLNKVSYPRWNAGGAGVFLDPWGDDTYTVGTESLGAGYALRHHCPQGHDNPDVPIAGVGIFGDVRGADTYLTPLDPTHANRTCSGSAQMPCPRDDAAWLMIRNQTGSAGARALASSLQSAAFVLNVSAETTPNIGIGFDGVRSAAMLLGGACSSSLGQVNVTIRPTKVPQEAQQPSLIPGASTGLIDVCMIVQGSLATALAPARSFSVNWVQAEPRKQEQVVSTELYQGPGCLRGAGTSSTPISDDAWLRLPNGTKARPEARACITVESVTAHNAWFTRGRADKDFLDVGDVATCNCTVSVRIDPLLGYQGSALDLATIPQDVYPNTTASLLLPTLTSRAGTWIAASARLETPLQGLTDGGDCALVPGTGNEAVCLRGEVGIPVWQLPQDLAHVRITVTMQDAFFAESGGLVPPAEQTFDVRLYRPGVPEKATLVEANGGLVLILESRGPLAKSFRIQVPTSEINSAPSAGWSWNNARKHLEREVRDLPAATPLVAGNLDVARATFLHGPETCGAYLSWNAGVCWTGERLVTVLPMGSISGVARSVHVSNGTETEVHTDKGPGNVMQIVRLESRTPEPVVQTASETTYQFDADITAATNIVQARGAPLSAAVEQGRAYVAANVDPARIRTPETDIGQWSLVRITQRDGPGAGVIPVDLNPTTASPDKIQVRILWNKANNTTAHVARQGELANEVYPLDNVADNVLQRDLSCSLLPTVATRQLRDALTRFQRDGNLTRAPCFAWSDSGDLVLLLPLGERAGSRFVVLNAAALPVQDPNARTLLSDGSPLWLHLDSEPPHAMFTVTPVRTRHVVLNGTVNLLNWQEGQLQTGLSDLVGVRLEVQAPDGTWTRPTTSPFSASPSPDTPEATQKLNLTSLLQGRLETDLSMRLVLDDESNHTSTTTPFTVRYDRLGPKLERMHLARGDAEDTLAVFLSEEARLACGNCSVRALLEIPGVPIQPRLDPLGVLSRGGRITLPVVGLIHGIPYEFHVEAQDLLGNRNVTVATIDTTAPVRLDLSPMEDALLNRSLILSWASRVDGNTSLMLWGTIRSGDASCPVLQGLPYTERPTPGLASHRIGPVPHGCTGLGESDEAVLEGLLLAPEIRGLAQASTPVRVDMLAPRIHLNADGNWSAGTVLVTGNVTDHNLRSVRAFVDDVPLELQLIDGEFTIPVDAEGVTAVRVEATDAAGNTASETVSPRIDRTPPTVAGTLRGRIENLALVEILAADEGAGVRHVRVVSDDGESSPVAPPPGRAVVLAVPIDPTGTEVRVQAVDAAGNERWERVFLDAPAPTAVPRIEPALEVLSPGQVRVTFTTPRAVAPWLLIDAGDVHLEQVLPTGTDHAFVASGLEPGNRATVTVALPADGTLRPAGSASVELPQDQIPPEPLQGVTLTVEKGAVRLTWQAPVDDSGSALVMIRRDGRQIANLRADTTYVDLDPPVDRPVIYALLPADLAGNVGPASLLETSVDPVARVLSTWTMPDRPVSDEPVTVLARVAHPGGVLPDRVVLRAFGTEVFMAMVSGNESMGTYAVQALLPARALAEAPPTLVVAAQVRDTWDQREVAVPLVTLPGLEPDGGLFAETPLPTLPVVLVLLLGALMVGARRRSR